VARQTIEQQAPQYRDHKTAPHGAEQQFGPAKLLARENKRRQGVSGQYQLKDNPSRDSRHGRIYHPRHYTTDNRHSDKNEEIPI